VVIFTDTIAKIDDTEKSWSTVGPANCLGPIVDQSALGRGARQFARALYALDSGERDFACAAVLGARKL